MPLTSSPSSFRRSDCSNRCRDGHQHRQCDIATGEQCEEVRGRTCSAEGRKDDRGSTYLRTLRTYTQKGALLKDSSFAPFASVNTTHEDHADSEVLPIISDQPRVLPPWEPLAWPRFRTWLMSKATAGKTCASPCADFCRCAPGRPTAHAARLPRSKPCLPTLSHSHKQVRWCRAAKKFTERGRTFKKQALKS